tara:strand:+ start:232 stop:951 length:720 start_codon:yes stop_codon:yes gene_type:complete
MIKENELLKLQEKTPDSERKYRLGLTFIKNGKNLGKMLTYVDARYVQDTLDKVVGIGNWDNEYFEIKGNMFCRITIRYISESGSVESVSKMDCGTESNVEKQKGEASDAFKRCAVHFGIARDLYSIEDPELYIVELENGKAPYNWKPTKPFKTPKTKTTESKENDLIEEVKEKFDGVEVKNVINFGKHNGKEWKDLEESYVKWVATKSNVDWQRNAANEELQRRNNGVVVSDDLEGMPN